MSRKSITSAARGRLTKRGHLMCARFALLTALVALFAAGSAAGETNSRPDGNDHPYVGQFVGDFNPANPGLEAGCSGTLVSPTVFLTAAHCIAGRPVRQRTQKYVTFDSAWARPGSPTDLHAVASYAWNPLFDAAGFSSKYEIAVFVLNEPVVDVTPAQLPTAGLLDELAAHGASSARPSRASATERRDSSPSSAVTPSRSPRPDCGNAARRSPASPR